MKKVTLIRAFCFNIFLVFTVFVLPMMGFNLSSAQNADLGDDNFDNFSQIPHDNSPKTEQLSNISTDPFTQSAIELSANNFDKARQILISLTKDRDQGNREKALWQLAQTDKEIMERLAKETRESLQNLCANFLDSQYGINALHESAKAHAQAQETEVALANYSRLIDNFPHYSKRIDAIYEYLELLYNRDPYDEGLEELFLEFTRDATDHPGLAQIFFRYARLLEKNQLLPKAASLYENIIQQWPQSPQAEFALDRLDIMAHQTKDLEKSLDYLRTKRASVGEFIALADKMKNEGHEKDATDLLKKLWDDNNKDISAALAYGKSLEITQDYDQAIQVYQKFIEKNPNDIQGDQIYYRLGLIYGENMNNYIFQGPGFLFTRNVDNIHKAVGYLDKVHNKSRDKNQELSHLALIKAARLNARDLYNNHEAGRLYQRLIREYPRSPFIQEAKKYLQMD